MKSLCFHSHWSPVHIKLLALLASLKTALLLTLAMPGLVGWWPLLFVALVPLLSLLRFLSPGQSLCMGLLTGLLYHSGLLYWIAYVLNRFGDLHPGLALGAMLVLALYMSLYTGLFCFLLNMLIKAQSSSQKASTAVLLAAPSLWVGLDYLRSVVFTGIPWMDLGYGLYMQPLLIQAADLGGHHLLTFCVVLTNALVYWLFDRLLCRHSEKGIWQHYLYVFMACLLLYGLSLYSVLRYQQMRSVESAADHVVVAAIQGNIDQSEKWSPALKGETVQRYLSLSTQALEQAEEKPSLIVWPETALPFYPTRDPMMQKVREFTRQHQLHVLTGVPYFTVHPDEDRRPVEYFNSALLVDPAGRFAGRYNKQHLVPFGEYVPLRNILWFVKPLVELAGDFTPGTSSDPLEVPHTRIKAGVLICFESIFPYIAQREVTAGANLLVNLTNDAWYGRSSAPYHSWAMTVLRAVENRRSMVRAANTGISGFVKPTGVIHAESPLFTQEAMTAKVALLNEKTVFSRGGHRFGMLCLMLIPLFVFFAKVQELQTLRRSMNTGEGK
jgi:apolipoprotein N-acyltransferase